MANDESIRKQVYDLLPSDLERFPIWEFALDEEGEGDQDEATVRPRPDLTEGDPSEGLQIVRAELVSADGTQFVGYVSPSFDFELGSIQPTVVTDKGQVGFWCGMLAPERSDMDGYYGLLGRTADQLFPLSFRASVPHRGAALDGEVPGFLYLQLKKLRRERVVSVS